MASWAFIAGVFLFFTLEGSWVCIIVWGCWTAFHSDCSFSFLNSECDDYDLDFGFGFGFVCCSLHVFKLTMSCATIFGGEVPRQGKL